MENDVKELPEQLLIAFIRYDSAVCVSEHAEEVVVESVEGKADDA